MVRLLLLCMSNTQSVPCIPRVKDVRGGLGMHPSKPAQRMNETLLHIFWHHSAVVKALHNSVKNSCRRS